MPPRAWQALFISAQEHESATGGFDDKPTWSDGHQQRRLPPLLCSTIVYAEKSNQQEQPLIKHAWILGRIRALSHDTTCDKKKISSRQATGIKVKAARGHGQTSEQTNSGRSALGCSTIHSKTSPEHNTGLLPVLDRAPGSTALRPPLRPSALPWSALSHGGRCLDT